MSASLWLAIVTAVRTVVALPFFLSARLAQRWPMTGLTVVAAMWVLMALGGMISGEWWLFGLGVLFGAPTLYVLVLLRARAAAK